MPILASFLLSGSGFAQITTFPWIEGFEGGNFPPTSWTSYDVDSFGTNWEKNPTEDYLSNLYERSSGIAGHTYYCDEGDQPQEGWLVTPQITIPTTGSFVLMFWSLSEYPEDYEYNGVWVSTTSNDPVTRAFTEIKELSGTEISGTWKKIIISLDDYAGEDIYIGFKYAGECADSWYIDDVTVLDFSDYVDGEVAAILSPNSGEGLTSNEEVKVLLKNNGSDPLTNFTLDLELDGTLIASETFTNVLASVSQEEYIFNAKLDLSNLSGYEIKVTINILNDQDTDNNSLIKKVSNFSSESITLYGFQFDFMMMGSGFISFESATPKNTTQEDYRTVLMKAGEYVNGYFYGYSQDIFGGWTTDFVKISTDDWTDIETIANEDNIVDMAYDFSTNVMYGINAWWELVIIDIETGEIIDYIGDFYDEMLVLACDLNGQLYGIDNHGNFCFIDKTDASTTVIANTGLYTINFYQSMAFDHNTERLFWTYVYPDNGNLAVKLIEIDPISGAIFDRGNFKEETVVTSLFTKYASPIDVMSLLPANNELNVALNAAVKVIFNQDITSGNLSGITISPTVSGVSAAISGNILSISHADFNKETQYTVTVPSGVINGYNQAITWKFTTGKGVNTPIYSENTIQIYPNPTNGQLQVTSYKLQENTSIEIYDIVGRVVLSSAMSKFSPETTIDISHLANGMYFLKIDGKMFKVIKN